MTGEFIKFSGTCAVGENFHTLSDYTGKFVPSNTDKFGVWDQESEYEKAFRDTDCDRIGKDVGLYYNVNYDQDFEYAR